MVQRVDHFIGGRSVGLGEPELEVEFPYTREALAAIPIGSDQAVDSALRSAAETFKSWKRTEMSRRFDLLDALRVRVERDQAELVDILVHEVGKPFRAARREVANLVASLVYFLEEGQRQLVPVKTYRREPTLRIVRDPVGVVAAITPFNFPAQLLSWKLCPAMLSGCTVVCKPDPRTPLSATRLAEWAIDVGWPPGLFNVLHGDATTGARLAGDPRVAKVAFTGSVSAGRAVYETAARGIKRATLELGGCSPLVVTSDAPLERNMDGVLERTLYNSGQYCFRINRAIVQRERYEEFLERFAQAADRLVVGDPREEATDLGPLIDQISFERVLATIAAAERGGARVVLDGRKKADPEHLLIGPTLLADVDPGAEILRTETFGPVLTCMPFEGLDEALALANGSDYGLAAFALAGDPETAQRLAGELEAGSVWVNALDRTCFEAPFGGIKQSGLGVEKSRWAFDGYLQARAIYLETPASAAEAPVRSGPRPEDR